MNVSSLFPSQGSTLRKRKMYEEFLSKVSILGECVYMHGLCGLWRITITTLGLFPLFFL